MNAKLDNLSSNKYIMAGKTPTIEKGIHSCQVALEAGISKDLILFALLRDGFDERRAEVILAWGLQKIKAAGRLESSRQKMKNRVTNMATYQLHKWAVVGDGDPWVAPELCSKRLTGYRDKETKQVVTSPIVKVEGKKITTRSGSVYILEDVSEQYREWLRDSGIPFNPEQPIYHKKSESV